MSARDVRLEPGWLMRDVKAANKRLNEWRGTGPARVQAARGIEHLSVTMRPRAWPVRWWGALRSALSDWLEAERFAWQVYSALRHMPRPFSFERLARCTDGWVAECVLPESGQRFQGVHAHPYVAIRRMSLAAQFERDAANDQLPTRRQRFKAWCREWVE